MSATDAATAASRGVVRAALARLPRVDLGVRETPFEPLPRLTAALGGPRLYIKRDDLAGGPLGGNKTRMLEFVLAKAVAAGRDRRGRWLGRAVQLLPPARRRRAPGSGSTATSCCA